VTKLVELISEYNQTVQQHVLKFLFSTDKNFSVAGLTWLAEHWECCRELHEGKTLL